MDNRDHSQHHGDAPPPRSSRLFVPLLTFAIAIGFLLLFEHRAHIPGDYVFAALILVLCGGMHFFMHGSHGGHGGHGGHGSDRSNRSRSYPDDTDGEGS